MLQLVGFSLARHSWSPALDLSKESFKIHSRKSGKDFLRRETNKKINNQKSFQCTFTATAHFQIYLQPIQL